MQNIEVVPSWRSIILSIRFVSQYWIFLIWQILSYNDLGCHNLLYVFIEFSDLGVNGWVSKFHNIYGSTL